MALPTSDSTGTSSESHTRADAAAAAAAPPSSDADMAQAFRDLARGEQTAQALESNLTSLERKLDDFLASFDEFERQRVEAVDSSKKRGEPNGKVS